MEVEVTSFVAVLSIESFPRMLIWFEIHVKLTCIKMDCTVLREGEFFGQSDFQWIGFRF